MAIDPTTGGAFGQCEVCPSRNIEDTSRCYACFRSVIPPIPTTGTCLICGQVKPDTRCRNALCNSRDRNFIWNRSLAYLDKDGPYYEVVVRKYKYRPRENKWGVILGRILAAYLEEQARVFEQFDHIIPNPIFVSSDGKRQWDPVAFILRSASALASDRWPIRDAGFLMAKTAETAAMMGSSRPERQAAAKELRDALRVVRPAEVRKKRILVFDDIFTEGSTLNEVAGCLKRSGAERVAGVTLGRIPWKEPATPAAPFAFDDFDEDIPF